jgi:hypothetical protein
MMSSFLHQSGRVGAASSNLRNFHAGDASDSEATGPRFNSVAESDVAKLLLQVRKIASHEIILQKELGSTENTPQPHPLKSPPRISLIRSSVVHRIKHTGLLCSDETRDESSIASSPPSQRSRIISFCSQELEESSMVTSGRISPHPSINCVQSPESLKVVLADKNTLFNDSDKICFPSSPKVTFKSAISSSPPTPLSPSNKKLVGDTVAEGNSVRGILRKKFSWKSFPELESYLIENRQNYLEYSNALNYTKAQKIYNNELTQGLLDRASETGYIFEGFTFAAVRDRIRCFYKSKSMFEEEEKVCFDRLCYLMKLLYDTRLCSGRQEKEALEAEFLKVPSPINNTRQKGVNFKTRENCHCTILMYIFAFRESPFFILDIYILIVKP